MSLSWLTTLSSYIYSDQPPDDTLQLTTDDILTIDDPSNSSSTSTTTTTTTTTTTSVQSSVKGLENLGNTCFFNASVQALLACPKFVEYIKILSKSHKENTSHSEYTPYEPLPSNNKNKNNEENKIFSELLVDLYTGHITSPKHLFSQLCAFHPTEFSSFTQSDAHESFNKMMEILEIEQLYIATESQSENVINNMFEFLDCKEEEEYEIKYEYKNNINNINSMDIQNIKNPFDGLLGNMVECMECKYSNESKQTSFRCLTLSLTDDLNIANGYDNINIYSPVKLTDRIDAFEKQEEIEGYRCVMCECKGIINQIKHKLNELNNKKQNDIEMSVLNEQYYELNDKLNKLLVNNNSNKENNNGNGYVLGMDNNKILNGYNGYGMYGNINGNINGKNNNTNEHITAKHRNKYRIDIGLNKLYRVKAKKKQFVSRYPNVLCIHLNRLQFGAKDSRYVSFKPLLSLNNNIKEINCRNPMFNENDYRLLSQYILMSVIVHHGSDLGGHYTTYKREINNKNIKNIYENGNGLEWKSLDELQLIENNSEWYHISDQFVNKVTITDVLTCKAYMLFYQKNQFSFMK